MPPSKFHLTRRGVLAGTAACASLRAFPAMAKVEGSGRKLAFILLRGGLDGLHLLPPIGDKSYAAARRDIAISPTGQEKGALELDGFFGLHPTMPRLHQAFHAKEAAFVHAVAPPYRHRSHFSAQEILENGTDKRGAKTGWLARALASHGDAGALQALSLGGSLAPLSLQGAVGTAAWSPGDPNMNQRTKEALKTVFRSDPLMADTADFVSLLDELAPLAPVQPKGDLAHDWKNVTASAARLLAATAGPDAVAIDLFGWDSHAWQGGAEGNLALLTGHLDAALAQFKEEMGDVWACTVVVVMTEFGRTVEVNGTGGTDHGVGGAAILLGGAVRGGSVIADWPGLAPSQRFEGRDLVPTTDTRSVLKGVLHDHWGISRKRLTADVFPDSGKVRQLDGLIHS